MDERQKFRIWDRDGGCCVLCGAPGNDWDHIEAKKMGGRKGAMKKWIERDDNIRILCRPCHHQRHFGGKVTM